MSELTNTLRRKLDDAVDAMNAELKPIHDEERRELNAAEDRYLAERKTIYARFRLKTRPIEQAHRPLLHTLRNQLQAAVSEDAVQNCGGDSAEHDPVLDSVKLNGDPSERELARAGITNILDPRD